MLLPISRRISAVFLCLWVGAAHAQWFNSSQPQLLPEQEAFILNAESVAGGVAVSWSIAEGYYMYRDQFAVELQLPASDESQPSTLTLPLTFETRGEIEDDPDFGEVEVFFFNSLLRASWPPSFVPEADTPYQLTIKGQGCNKPVGVCYPPMARPITLSWTAEQLQSAVINAATSEEAAPATSTAKSFWAYVLSAFGAGLLLSFTPCVLPMIPILSGVIAQQGSPTKLQSGWLAICYVAGTVVTYMIAGWVAGATGTQLQAYFQNPWVIGTLCFILLALAMSLFGAFKIQTPAALQTKIHGAEIKSGGLVLLKSFGLGLGSALVVGACVSPVLILALGAAITQSDPVLGAGIMGAMALGMGVLLIVFGFGAGWLLPKTGEWMQEVQTFFGFMVVGVAIFIASALPAVPVLLLWALLLLCFGFYLWQLSHRESDISTPGLMASAGKGLAFGLLLWGALALIGHATGGRDITSPLSGISFAQGAQSAVELPFETTTTLAQTSAILDDARANGEPVLVDFYADWCFDCVRMKRTTFKSEAVALAVEGWRLVVVDVTDTSPQAQEVKQFFNVFGPPATLFYGADGNEVTSLRQYGFIEADAFIAMAGQVESAR